MNRIRLKNYAAQRNKKASVALEIAEKYDKTITAILIGNNIVNTASAAVGTILFTDLFGSKGLGAATAIMTVSVLIFGEIIPKSIAKENAERFALSVSGILRLIILVLTPFTLFFSHLKRGVARLINSGDTQPSVTENELEYIIEEIENQGVLEEQESELVQSALDFDEIVVNEILIPRVNIVGIEINQTFEEIKQLFLKEMYSRMPVYDKTIDNIIGVINEKDFLKMMVNGGDSIESIVTMTIYISGLRPISEILREMQHSKTHMAIVMDQYGGTQGLVTMEDIIEELVGEIYDENDEVVPQKTGKRETCISQYRKITYGHCQVKYLKISISFKMGYLLNGITNDIFF